MPARVYALDLLLWFSQNAKPIIKQWKIKLEEGIYQCLYLDKVL